MESLVVKMLAGLIEAGFHLGNGKIEGAALLFLKRRISHKRAQALAQAT